MTLVNYSFAMENGRHGLVQPGCLYEYIVGSNGVFLRSNREGLEVMHQIGYTPPINGLRKLNEQFELVQRIPYGLFKGVLVDAWKSYEKEKLYYFIYEDGWRVYVPAQRVSGTTVHPIDQYDPLGVKALIELHSHGTMHAVFSPQDNRDETGFRIYSVIGNMNGKLEITTRVGVYGQFWNIPSTWVYDYPGKIIKDWNDNHGIYVSE